MTAEEHQTLSLLMDLVRDRFDCIEGKVDELTDAVTDMPRMTDTKIAKCREDRVEDTHQAVEMAAELGAAGRFVKRWWKLAAAIAAATVLTIEILEGVGVI